MRTQWERDAKVRFRISLPSFEKIDSQIPGLKKTDLNQLRDIDQIRGRTGTTFFEKSTPGGDREHSENKRKRRGFPSISGSDVDRKSSLKSLKR